MRAMTLCFRATLSVFMIVAVAKGALADARTRFSRHLPEGTSFAAFSEDIAGTCAAFQKMGIGEALCGQAFTPLRSELAKQEQASALYLRPVFGFDWSDLENVHEPGGIAVFGLADGATGVAWLFAPETPAEKTPACLIAAGRYFDQAKYKRELVEHQGSKLAVYRRSETADEGASSQPATAVLFRTADAYGVANSLAAAQAVLRAVKEASSQPGNAGTPRAEWLTDAPGSAANVSLFIRPFALWDLLTRQPDGSVDSKKEGSAIEDGTAESPNVRAERLGYASVSTVRGMLRFALIIRLNGRSQPRSMSKNHTVDAAGAGTETWASLRRGQIGSVRSSTLLPAGDGTCLRLCGGWALCMTRPLSRGPMASDCSKICSTGCATIPRAYKLTCAAICSTSSRQPFSTSPFQEQRRLMTKTK